MLEGQTKKFLDMNPEEFDQDENGWRSLVGNIDEEEIANLILKYIELSSDKINKYNEDKIGKNIFPIDLLYFHAGQSFGTAGANYYKKAIECFKKSYSKDSECWNAYVNGTIAFLEGKRGEVKRQINVVQNSKSANKRGGNVGILKNFLKCLNKGIVDYEVAYSMPLNPPQ